MDCNRKTENMKYCNCTYSCSKKGKCCECLHYHRSIGQLPACYFDKNTEKTYDRSMGNFIRMNKKG
jgi:hypothetical protein